MEARGMRRGEEESPDPLVEASLRILRFGEVHWALKMPEPAAEEEKRKPCFKEPLTTGIQEIEILFKEGATYSVPRNTAGD